MGASLIPVAGVGQEVAQGLAPAGTALLALLKEKAERAQRQQALTAQYGQLMLEQQKFDEDMKAKREEKKAREEQANAIVEQFKNTPEMGPVAQTLAKGALQGPQGLSAALQAIEGTTKLRNTQERQQKFAEIDRAFAGREDPVSALQKTIAQISVDPGNPEVGALSSLARDQLATLQRQEDENKPKVVSLAPDATLYGVTTDAKGNSRAVKLAEGKPKPITAAGGFAQLIGRIAPRLPSLQTAIQGMTDIENRAIRGEPEAVAAINQVAGANASGRIKLGPIDVGSLLEWYKGLGFNGLAKQYANYFTVAADNLIGMQFNVRSQQQVELWKQSLIPYLNEVGTAALPNRQKLREEMVRGYMGVLQGRLDPAQSGLDTAFFNPVLLRSPQFSPDNPYAPSAPAPQ